MNHTYIVLLLLNYSENSPNRGYITIMPFCLCGRSGIFVLKLKKKINVEIKCKRQFIYRLYQHLASFTNIIITNANVNIYIKN